MAYKVAQGVNNLFYEDLKFWGCIVPVRICSHQAYAGLQVKKETIFPNFIGVKISSNTSS